jgi:hypothetical protein
MTSAPGFLPERQMQRLDRLLGGLLRCEARPFVPAIAPRRLRLLEIALRLLKPIGRTIRHQLSDTSVTFFLFRFTFFLTSFFAKLP